jgi:hypothetical protein
MKSRDKEIISVSESRSLSRQIGTVVDAVGSDTKKILNGKEYDYVFDVDLEVSLLLFVFFLFSVCVSQMVIAPK